MPFDSRPGALAQGGARWLVPLIAMALGLAQLFVSRPAALAQGPNAASDWPQFLGPGRDGVYRGPAIAEAWGKGGPRVVWQKSVGQGFSGPVVTGGRLILFHRVGAREMVEAFDAKTGAQHWSYGYPTAYRDDFGFDEGPRAVPVVAGGVVYTFGAEGQLHAVSLDSGTRLWTVDTMRRYGVPKAFFGAGGSPLVEGGRVIANVGGRGAGIVAFDARTGAEQWKATDDEASYSSGTVATLGGRKVAVFLTRTGLVGLDPSSGQVLFQRRWRSRQNASVNAATPIVVGDLIFVSAEYSTGAATFQLKGTSLAELWSSEEVLSNHYATSVYSDGIVFGYHGRQEFGQSFRAVDFRTGKVRWTDDGVGAGSVLLAGDRLLMLRESGELVLAAATPDAFRPLARARILPAPVRAFPALADGRLYARNDKTLVCVDLNR